MPAKTKLVFSVSRDGPGFIVVEEDADQVMHLISSVRSEDENGFVKLTVHGGNTAHVAVARILYVEPD
jgi:mevalonate pyrophosphate decarboxylase